MTDIDGDDRTIVNLLTDQIEFANVLVLNKTDLVTTKQLGFLEAALRKLNPGAKIVHSEFSKVDPAVILNTGMFDFEEAEQSAGWIAELEAPEHTPETEEYGIGSFVFRSKKPFHPDRFWNYVQRTFPPNVFRSKGLFWLASRPDQALIWGQAGGSLRADSAGVWWASMTFEKRSRYMAFVENQAEIESDWDTTFGDRKNELVFIGQDLDRTQITAELTACLVDDADIASGAWQEPENDMWPVERTYAY